MATGPRLPVKKGVGRVTTKGLPSLSTVSGSLGVGSSRSLATGGPPLEGALESDLYRELWSKLRWALGSAFQCEYGKKSRAGEVARRIAAVCIDAMGTRTAVL